MIFYFIGSVSANPRIRSLTALFWQLSIDAVLWSCSPWCVFDDSRDDSLFVISVHHPRTNAKRPERSKAGDEGEAVRETRCSSGTDLRVDRGDRVDRVDRVDRQPHDTKRTLGSPPSEIGQPRPPEQCREFIYRVSGLSLIQRNAAQCLTVPSGDQCDGNASQNITQIRSLSQLECAKGNCAEEFEATRISATRRMASFHARWPASAAGDVLE